jgi:WD40 repeat protein
MGMLVTGLSHVSFVATDAGRVLVDQARERRLVGGAPSPEEESDRVRHWIEVYAPAVTEPLVRWPVGYPSAVALSEDGARLALVDQAERITFAPVAYTFRRFDARTGRALSAEPASEVLGLQFGPPDKTLFALTHSGTKDSIEGRLELWDDDGHVQAQYGVAGRTPSEVRVYPGHGGRLHDTLATEVPSLPVSVASTPDVLAAGSSDGAVWVWRRTEGAPRTLAHWKPARTVEEVSAHMPLALAFEAAGKELLVAYGDGTLVRWDVGAQRELFVAGGACKGLKLSAENHENDGARCARTLRAAFSPDHSRVLLVGSLSTRVRSRDGEPISVLPVGTSPAASLSGQVGFEDGAGRHVWVGNNDEPLGFWDTSTGKKLSSLAQGGVSGSLYALSGDGRYVVTRAAPPPFGSGRLRVWDSALRTEVAAAVPSDAREVTLAAKSATLLFLPAQSPVVTLVDLADGKPATIFAAPGEGQFFLSPDARRAVSVGDDGKALIVRDLPQGRRLIELGGRALDIGVDREARHAVTRTSADVIRVHDLDDGRCLLEIAAPRDSRTELALSPAGKKFVYRDGPGNFVTVSVEDGKARPLLTREQKLKVAAAKFLTEDELLLVGSEYPYSIHRLARDGTLQRTELSPNRCAHIAAASSSVAAVYDCAGVYEDMVHLLRADGTLLATVYATSGGDGWIAQSRDGAIDGSDEGRSALLTDVGGRPASAFSSFMGWDRFEVRRLLERAARGERVAPVFPASVASTEALARAASRAR